MEAIHLPKSTTPVEVSECLRKEGYAIVDELVGNELMDRISDELATYIDSTEFGVDGFTGKRTKRTGSLIARSPAARELIMNPLALGITKDFLGHASSFQLHLSQIISVYPGSPAQAIHQDQLAWDFFPFPDEYHVQCNILWAMTDYTEEMGATRIVPGSQYGTNKNYDINDSIPAEMKRGSALFYTGKVFHGAGANTSDRVRQAINITYAVGWVRQEENQYLSTPFDVARELPEDLLKLMGYDYGCFAIGYVGDAKHPMTALKPDWQAPLLSTEEMERKVSDSEAAAFIRETAKS